MQAIGLLHYFDESVILGRDEAAPKPHPAGIDHILQHWQANSDDAIMVGDYEYDLSAGRSAGVHTLLVHPKPTTGQTSAIIILNIAAAC